MAPCRQPGPDRKDLQPVCQDHTEIREGKFLGHPCLSGAPQEHTGSVKIRCLTPMTPPQLQSSLQEDPAAQVGSAPCMQWNTAPRTRILAGVRRTAWAGGGERENLVGGPAVLHAPAPQGVTRGTEMSTYWPPRHVSASEEIATDGVPVHPARRLGGERDQHRTPFPTNPDVNHVSQTRSQEP